MIYHDSIQKNVPKEVLSVSIGDIIRIWTYTKKFAKVYLKRKEDQARLNKQLHEILINPFCGKPMSGNRKGLWELYHDSWRLYYTFDKEKNLVTITEFSHKDYQ